MASIQVRADDRARSVGPHNGEGAWNEHPRPYVWHLTADEIHESLSGYLTRIADSGPYGVTLMVDVTVASTFFPSGRMVPGRRLNLTPMNLM